MLDTWWSQVMLGSLFHDLIARLLDRNHLVFQVEYFANLEFVSLCRQRRLQWPAQQKLRPAAGTGLHQLHPKQAQQRQHSCHQMHQSQCRQEGQQQG